MKKQLLITLLSCMFLYNIGTQLHGQSDINGLWNLSDQVKEVSAQDKMLDKMPENYQYATLNVAGLTKETRKATKVETRDTEKSPFLIEVPNPEGSYDEFYIFENSVVAPEVAHFYNVKTFQGYSKESPEVHIRCSISDNGFNAFIFDNKNSYAVEPLSRTDNTIHLAYYKKDLDVPKIMCGVSEGETRIDRKNGHIGSRDITQLRTYRLCYTASGEFTVHFGGVTPALAAIATGINMVNAIYERDMGVIFTSVTIPALIYPDPATDPFNLADQSDLIDQNQIAINASAVGSTGYDIGHCLVWSNTGGLAYGGVCDPTYKGRAFSGSDGGMSTLFIDYSCHEIGHQFGGSHNYASVECGTSQTGFLFEPGEGTSIMSYANACTGGAEHYQTESDPFFHDASITAMQTFITEWATCPTNTNTSNANAPSVNAGSDLTIPKQTPFVLVGSATDPDNNGLTYGWDEHDSAPTAVTGSPNCMSTTDPLFRFRSPASDNFRVFPEMSYPLAGNNNGSDWDKLPCAARSINFNLIARDNFTSHGRTGNDAMVITVANTGPFEVTTPTSTDNWPAESTKTVIWNENGTSAHCPNVDILVSTDDGVTFTTVASAVTNNGSYTVSVPVTITSTARVLVQCSTGVNFKMASTFFDVSEAFNITTTLPVELLFFEAEKYSDSAVKISWKTATETNVSHFELEKSSDGIEFSTFDKNKGIGKSKTENNYSLIDNTPYQGVNYYRLKQVDLDGKFEYSNIKVVNFNSAINKILVYPNPAKNTISILELNAKDIDKIQIFDCVGKTLTNYNVNKNLIDVSSFKSGLYFIAATTNDKVHFGKFIIQ